MPLRPLTHATLVIALFAAAACTPARQHQEKNPSKKESAAPAAVASFPKVTFHHEVGPLGDLVRKLGRESGGGIVTMSGLEERSVPSMDLEHQPYATVVSRLAQSVECTCAPLSHAYFVYPEPYASLLQVSLEGRLTERFSSMNAAVAFGARTRLANVFAVLGESLGTAIIADNFIADATCGEMFMDRAPLQAILEAVLMSARIPAQEIAIDCTDEYLFIASLRNTTPRTVLLSDENALTAEQKASLERVVDVVLPDLGTNAIATAFAARAVPLKDILTPLTRQIGIEVAAKRVLADIPINPCTMHKVRIRTAMDLLIRQWPVANFGFEVNDNQILIRPKQ